MQIEIGQPDHIRTGRRFTLAHASTDAKAFLAFGRCFWQEERCLLWSPSPNFRMPSLASCGMAQITAVSTVVTKETSK